MQGSSTLLADTCMVRNKDQSGMHAGSLHMPWLQLVITSWCLGDLQAPHSFVA
jgi:hypothetical protein